MTEKMMKCPFCDFDCVHMETVKVNRGGEITRINGNGTRMSAGSPSGRGACVEMVFWCESGHKWRRTLQFHKGAVEVSDKLIFTIEDGAGEDICGDLWRD